MSYQVLARKWRPQSFAEMVGQQHVLTALTNALAQQRLHHAYLFTGTRGVGKTTLARLLAKSLNCESGISAEPCNQCENCQAITHGCAPDLIEVDAASRTKVEDTRQLLDNIPYAPTQARFKVYLIDEVHMLSTHSFNALLKTLEEPPEHVKFLLATTDPQKLPITVLSRCLQFHLKHLSPSQIAGHLQHVLTQESVPFETPALTVLAEAAQGSVRDALSLLDQAIAYGQNSVKQSAVEQMLGQVGAPALLAIFDALAANDGPALLQACQKLVEDGADLLIATQQLLKLLQALSLLQTVPEAEDTLSLSTTQLKPYASQFTPEMLQLYYQILLLGRRDLPLAPTPEIGFSMLMMRLLTFTTQTPPPSVIVQQPANSNQNSPTTQPAVLPTTSELSSATPNAMQPPRTTWVELIARCQLKGMTKALADQCELITWEGQSLELKLNAQHAAMLSSKLKHQLQTALCTVLGDDIRLSITPGQTQSSPSEQAKQAAQAKHQAAKQSLGDNASLQSVLNAFETELDPNSIQSKSDTQ